MAAKAAEVNSRAIGSLRRFVAGESGLLLSLKSFSMQGEGA